MANFYRPTYYNGDTKGQMWLSIVGDAHDMHCGCQQPFAHLLQNIFPEGHKDRNLTVDQIITRDFKECPFGGEEEKDTGMALGTSAATLKDLKQEEEDFQDDTGVEELLAAAASAEAR